MTVLMKELKKQQKKFCKKNTKLDGSHYDIYSDGLKIYTTLNSHMQKYAEEAVVEHLSQDLHPSKTATTRIGGIGRKMLHFNPIFHL